jgi:hypothetical protein
VPCTSTYSHTVDHGCLHRSSLPVEAPSLGDVVPGSDNAARNPRTVGLA